MSDVNLKPAIRNTVQDLPDVKNGAGGAAFDLWAVSAGRLPLLPAWGTRARERSLRAWDREDYQLLWSSAVAGLLNRWASVQWEIKSDDDTSGENGIGDSYHEILTQAQFGLGWTTFVKMIGREFLRHDIGAFIEIIGAGDPMKPLTGQVIGIAHLDSLRCIPTGDPEYPVIYYAIDGKMHRMHRTRVYQLVDMPDGDESYPGVGRCALSRAITVLEREVLMNQYIRVSLDDEPKPGIALASGMNEETRNKAFANYLKEQQRDAKQPWGRTAWLYSLDAKSNPVTVEFKAFAEPPEKFDFREYTELNVNALALALGVDKLDLWELTSSALGSGQQSAIMASKSKGRTFGAFLVEFERFMNELMPDSLEFAFNTRDSQDDMETARAAQMYTNVAKAASGMLSIDEQRRYLANQVESISNAITDTEGNVQRYDDTRDQAKPEDMTNAPEQQPQPGQQPPPQQGAQQQQEQKAYDDTRSEFVARFVALVRAGAADEVTRRRFGFVLRGHLQQLGRQAFRDGLAAGGVQDEMSDEDRAKVALWLKEQSAFVTKFANELYSKGLPESMVVIRAQIWANKSLETMYQAGIASADANGMYMWQLGNTEEHCKTCLACAGQVHRMKTWQRTGLMPKAGTLECGGWQCDCSLSRTDSRARGRLSRVPKAAEKEHHAHHQPRDEHGRFVRKGYPEFNPGQPRDNSGRWSSGSSRGGLLPPIPLNSRGGVARPPTPLRPLAPSPEFLERQQRMSESLERMREAENERLRNLPLPTERDPAWPTLEEYQAYILSLRNAQISGNRDEVNRISREGMERRRAFEDEANRLRREEMNRIREQKLGGKNFDLRVTASSHDTMKQLGIDSGDVLIYSGISELPDSLVDRFPVRISSRRGEIEVEIGEQDSGFIMKRTLHYTDAGTPDYIHNDLFFLPEEHRGGGLGTRIFASEVEAAARAGFDHIETTAGRSESMNGYYTWPRLGYDAEIDSYDLPDSLSSAQYVSDLMRTQEGRDWWRENGYQTEMRFDLSNGSLSRAVLDAYLKEKGLR